MQKEKGYTPDWNEDNPRCSCGHLINKSHTINMKKTMKSGQAYAKCNFCNCKKPSME